MKKDVILTVVLRVEKDVDMHDEELLEILSNVNVDMFDKSNQNVYVDNAYVIDVSIQGDSDDS